MTIYHVTNVLINTFVRYFFNIEFYNNLLVNKCTNKFMHTNFQPYKYKC